MGHVAVGWDAWMQGPQAERVGLRPQSQAMCALQQAAGLGAMGEERRRTATSTGRSSCRSMHHGRDVDLDLEDVRTGVDEPPEKKRRAKK